MSHFFFFFDFDVTELDKLRRNDNYKIWAPIVQTRMLDFDYHLDLSNVCWNILLKH